MSREAFLQERQAILSQLQRTWDAAQARLASAGKQEETVARQAFANAKQALDASARRNGISLGSGIDYQYSMGDADRIKAQAQLTGASWRKV